MENQQQAKWWMNEYLIGALLLFFFPIGLILLIMKAYRDPRPNPTFGRIIVIISIVFFLAPVISLIINMSMEGIEEIQKTIQNYSVPDYVVLVGWGVIWAWIIHLGNKIRKGKPQLQYQQCDNRTNEKSMNEEQVEEQTVKCKNCGATNRIIEGQSGECEYCGTPLQ